jgi:dihydrofolate synthase/folylpolyglutamate synthase
MSPTIRNYEDTVNYLYNLRKHGIKLGLSNIRGLMSILGEPHSAFKSIHIAGTNGKGSTASILASILKENGFRVGLYTSPHLTSFTERIKINNRKIYEDEVIKLTTRINNLIKDRDLKPTFFEFVTAMAFYYFALKRVDWAVVETGMGGRFDATNVIDPDVSIITNVGIDHVEFLGGSIPEIAFEKAGIIKKGVPVITASGHPDAIREISEIANKSDSHLHIYDRDFRSKFLSMNAAGIHFDYYGYNDYKDLFLSITGKHQLHNVSLAIRACEILQNNGIDILETSIIEGLKNVKLEGRFEIISLTPVMILDGAHNPEAADTLCETINGVFADKKCIVVTGILKDKDAKGILKSLSRIADTMILTRPKGERAIPTEKLNEYLRSFKETYIERVILTDNVEEALNVARREWDKDSIILITGSFYTTGEVKELFGHQAVLSGLRE